MEKNNKVRVTLSLSKDVNKKLIDLAKKNGLNKSSLVNLLVLQMDNSGKLVINNK